MATRNTAAQRMDALEAKFSTVLDMLGRIASEDALERAAAPARPASKTRPRTFATKAERAAGDGFPCTVEPSCGRTNLRTPVSGASHDSTQPHWHTAAK